MSPAPTSSVNFDAVRMKSRDRSREPSDGNTGPTQAQQRPWASGRVLTAEQRARKREVDRNAGRFMKKEVLERICALEDQYQTLESRVIQHEQQLSATSHNAPASNGGSGPSPASSHLDFYSVRHPREATATTLQEGSHSIRNPGNDYAEKPARSTVYEAHAPAYSAVPIAPNGPTTSWVPPPLSSTMINNRTPPEFFSNFHRFILTPDLSSAMFMPPMAPQGREMTMQFNQLAVLVSQMPTTLTCSDEAINCDIIIRAVLDGWEAAFSPREPHICPLWRVLRQVDFWLFRDLGIVDRLANLHAMHRVYVHLVQARPLPTFYVPSLAQTMLEHDSVIEYLPWPALREHLILHEKTEQILDNRFWMDYSHAFQFLWPFSTLEAVTIGSGGTSGAQYGFSEKFQTNFHNLASFSLPRHFADKYPEVWELTRIERQHQFMLVT